jgi:hypothetical protein
MSEEVISQFIVDCASRGITQPDGIRQEALAKIKSIDELLAEADKLRPIRSNMVNVIRSFGFDIPKHNRRIIPVLAADVSAAELNPFELSQVIQICNYLEDKESVTPRELMTQFGILPEKDYEIYTLVKWLCAGGYCSRIGSGALIKGENWSNRPVKQ